MQESINTRKGIQQFLDDKKEESYNKLILLSVTYRIDHKKPIYIPTQFTLGLNGSTIKLNQFEGENTLMIDLNDTFASDLINGTIEGDYFTHSYNGYDEQNHDVKISSGSRYNSIKNIIVKNIVGYGTSNRISQPRYEKAIVIGKILMLSPSFPPPHTVRETFASYGVPTFC